MEINSLTFWHVICTLRITLLQLLKPILTNFIASLKTLLCIFLEIWNVSQYPLCYVKSVVQFFIYFQNMFNVTAMRLLLNEAKKKSLLHNSINGNITSFGSNDSFGNEHDSFRGASNHLFDSINATLQKDISLLLSLSDLDAHSLWLKTAHDRKKLIKEVN